MTDGKKFLQIALALCIVATPLLLLTSCDKDEPDNKTGNSSNNGTNSGNNNGSSNNSSSSNDNQDSDISLNMHYALERIDKTTKYATHTSSATIFSSPSYNSHNNYAWMVLYSYNGEYQSVNITYNRLTSIVVDEYNINTYTLNTKGLIVKKVQDHNGKYPDYTTTYSYDSKNRLTEVYNDAPGEGWIKYNISYDAYYNISEVIRQGNLGSGIFTEGERYEYSNRIAKMVPWYFASFLYEYELPLLEQGVFGPSMPVNLVTAIRSSETYELLVEFSYTINVAGYVTKIVKKSYLPSETVITTYTLKWKEVSKSSYTEWLYTDVTSPFYRYL